MDGRGVRCLLASAALAAMGAAHAASIDTVAAWNGVTNITDFGPSVTATYGQTITAAADDAVLLSFTFHARLTAGTPFPMRAKVYRWDPGTSRATGAPLFESAPVTLTGAAFQPYTFNIPGGVAVTPGQQYVMFVTISQDLPLPAGFGPFGAPPGSSYADGSFVYQNNGANTASWTTLPWIRLAGVNNVRDLAFSATFAAPTSLAAIPAIGPWGFVLLAGAVVAMGVKTRRRPRA